MCFLLPHSPFPSLFTLDCPASSSDSIAPSKVRIQPSSSYFENAHTVGQRQLEEFRAAMDSCTREPYQFVLRQSKVPWSLLSDPAGLSPPFDPDLCAHSHSHSRQEDEFDCCGVVRGHVRTALQEKAAEAVLLVL